MDVLPKLSILLPNIRSCHNVGAVFRTADACAFDKVYLGGYTACPPKPQIDKVSLGAEKVVPFEHISDVSAFLFRLKQQGVSIISLEKTNASIPLEEVPLREPTLLVLGNEVDGVSDDVQSISDYAAHIPMYGIKESLNVSIAAGIAMYTLRRRLGPPDRV